MRRAGRGANFLVLTVLLGGTASCTGSEDWVHRKPLEGAVSFGFDGSWEDEETVGYRRELEFEERVRVRQDGDILDPQIAKYSLEVEPVFTQDASNFETDTQNHVLNYRGSLNTFSGPPFPVGADAAAARTTGDIDGNLGSRTEFDNLTWDAAVNWKNRYLPSSVRYSELYQDQTFRSGSTDTISLRDDVLRRVAFQGRSSKTFVQVSREWFDDRIETRDADQTTDRADLTHNYVWGKGSRLDTTVRYYDREESFESSSFRAGESAHIRHTDNFSSTTAYNFTKSTAADTKTITHNVFSGLDHQLYQNLSTSLNSSANFSDSDVVNEKQYGSELRFNYRKGIFWDGQLRANLGGGYRVTDRDSKAGFLDVVDESHAVPPSLRVLLDRRFIDQGSIVITDSSGVVVFDEGNDYTINSRADDFTEIRIVSGGQINVGDTILASYRYESLPSQKFDTVPYQIGAGVDFGWIALTHATSGQESSLISGSTQSRLLDSRDSATELELRWIRPGTRATLSTEKRYSRLGNLKSDALSFAQSLGQTLSPRASLYLAANQLFVNSEDIDTELYQANVSINWRPFSRFSVSPFASAFIRKEQRDSPSNDEREEYFLSAGVDLAWSWRKVELTARYNHDRRRGDVNHRDEDRVMLHVSRRF